MTARPHDVIHLPTGSLVTPATLPMAGTPVGLPAPLTRLIGRDRQVSDLAALVAAPDVRLVTLTGPGGIGKTRLAIATAHALVDRFDRVVFVPLVPVRDVADVPGAIARRLDLREAPGRSVEDGLRDSLRHGSTLLVLDNMEHLIGAAGLVAHLLHDAPALRVLVTSRVPLRIAGEHEREVPALALPEPLLATTPADLAEFPAIALFLERVRGFQPDFSPDERQLADIAGICAQVDGLPLAIELAAARLRILGPGALRQRLDARLSLLTGGGPEHAAHQRTMRTTIAWSADLLGPGERTLFRHLAVFAGPFELAAAEAISPSPSTLDPLLGLVDHNLVRRDVLPDGSVRFRMLATIREFALELLAASDEADLVRGRFARYMENAVRAALPHLNGPDHAAWTARLEREQPNIEAALQWLADSGETDALLTLLTRLQPFWLTRGQFDIGRRWLERGVVIVDSAPHLLPSLGAAVAIAAGRLALFHGDPDTAQRHATRALDVAGDDPAARARALTLRGQVAHRRTDYPLAREDVSAALRLYEQLADIEAVGTSLQMLALIALNAGELDEAERLVDQSLAACEQAGNAIGAATALDTLSIVRAGQGDPVGAEALAQQALEVFRAHQSVRHIAVTLDHIGKCASRRGDVDRAWQAHRESIGIRLQYGDPRGLAVWLEAVAAMFASRNEAAMAARLLGAADRIRDEWRVPLHGHEAIEHGHVLARLGRDLDRDAIARLLAEGRGLGAREAIDLAIENGDQAPPPVAPDPLAGYHLTPREREVLQLLTRRLSDREIADALYISPRTVARHLAGLFAKLDVHSRREAADLARASGAFPDAG